MAAALRTFAKVDEYGSSKVAQMRGLMRCQHVRSPFWYSSSRPNFFMMSSSVGLSMSSSRPSRICRVSWVSRCVVYVIQQHGSTFNTNQHSGVTGEKSRPTIKSLQELVAIFRQIAAYFHRCSKFRFVPLIVLKILVLQPKFDIFRRKLSNNIKICQQFSDSPKF